MSDVSEKTYDLAIIGGGIVGLWCAYFAQQAGLKTALFDSQKLASGASNGLLGALMPHMPTQWNGKKQFQFDGLVDLELLVKQLEQSTGINCGYARVGRILPLTRPEHKIDAEARGRAAFEQWLTPDHKFDMKLISSSPVNGWPSPHAMGFGATFDTLSARVNPRGVTSALTWSLKKSINPKVDIFEDHPVSSVAHKTLQLPHDRSIGADHIIITAGLGSFDLLAPYAPSLAGRPVKGQAAILDTKLDPSLPIIYQNGIYLIVHEDGRTAIGSTSERAFDEGCATDHLLDDIIEKARAICPLVADAPVAERWAHVRMQPIGRDPLLGTLPTHKHLHLATGGFKISFGIAHRMAQAILAPIVGHPPILVPDSFRIENRLTS